MPKHAIHIKLVNVAKPGKNPVYQFKAVPSVLRVDSKIKGHQVQWINDHGGTAKLTFPNADRVFKNTAKSHSADIPSDQDQLDVLDSPTRGTYDYRVFCEQTVNGQKIQDHAQGDSDPRINVD